LVIALGIVFMPYARRSKKELLHREHTEQMRDRVEGAQRHHQKSVGMIKHGDAVDLSPAFFKRIVSKTRWINSNLSRVA
jgi:hypothetical protein